jgi:tetratricopeptide (TPR) repeat protein
MLATVREYALDVLEGDGRLETAQTSHLAHLVALADEAEAGFEGSEPTAWLERIERDLDNVRAALGFAFATGRTEQGLRIASALSRFWRAHGHAGEARRWLAQGLAQADAVGAEVRARALWAAARQAMAQRATADAEALVTKAIPYFRETGRDREVVFALSELATIAVERDAVLAMSLCEDAVALARGLDDPRALSGALNAYAGVMTVRGEHARSVALYEEALELRRALGDALLVADSTYNLGEAAFLAGDTARAKQAFTESLARARELGERLYVAACTCMLGEVALREGDLARAVSLLEESLAIYVDVADDRTSAECLFALAGVAAAAGEHAEAARLWGAADTLRGDDPLLPSELDIEARYLQALAGKVGDLRPAELRAEGASRGLDVLAGAEGVQALVASEEARR